MNSKSFEIYGELENEGNLKVSFDLPSISEDLSDKDLIENTGKMGKIINGLIVIPELKELVEFLLYEKHSFSTLVISFRKT